MSDDPKIRLLFESRLKQFAELEDIPVQWENERFDAPENEDPRENTYLQAFTLRAGTTSDDLAGDHTAYRGLFQVNVVTAKGIGAGLAEEFAVKLFNLFSINLRLSTSDGFTVVIMTPVSIANGLTGDKTFTVPTSCRYRADTL